MKNKKLLQITIVVFVIAVASLGFFLMSEKNITKSDYDKLEIFALENVQNGEKIDEITVTSQEKISECITFFESEKIKGDAEISEKSKPYYYRFYKDDEIVLEYIFQDNDFTLMYTTDGLKK